HLVSMENEATGEKREVDSIKPPHSAESGHMVEFIIRQPKFTRAGKHDEITGVVHEGKFIHLHPDEYEDKGALEAAQVLHIKAKQRTGSTGFVNAHGHIVYHAHSVTVDNHQPV